MTRSIVEARGPRVKGPSTHDTHCCCWLRNDDRQPIRGGRIEYGNNRVQEIVSGTKGKPGELSAHIRMEV